MSNKYPGLEVKDNGGVGSELPTKTGVYGDEAYLTQFFFKLTNFVDAQIFMKISHTYFFMIPIIF